MRWPLLRARRASPHRRSPCARRALGLGERYRGPSEPARPAQKRLMLSPSPRAALKSRTSPLLTPQLSSTRPLHRRVHRAYRAAVVPSAAQITRSRAAPRIGLFTAISAPNGGSRAALTLRSVTSAATVPSIRLAGSRRGGCTACQRSTGRLRRRRRRRCRCVPARARPAEVHFSGSGVTMVKSGWVHPVAPAAGGAPWCRRRR